MHRIEANAKPSHTAGAPRIDKVAVIPAALIEKPKADAVPKRTIKG